MSFVACLRMNAFWAYKNFEGFIVLRSLRLGAFRGERLPRTIQFFRPPNIEKLSTETCQSIRPGRIYQLDCRFWAQYGGKIFARRFVFKQTK